MCAFARKGDPEEVKRILAIVKLADL